MGWGWCIFVIIGGCYDDDVFCYIVLLWFEGGYGCDMDLFVGFGKCSLKCGCKVEGCVVFVVDKDDGFGVVGVCIVV